MAMETPAAIPASLNVNQLQALAPSELDELCRAFELRFHPGRTRHHQIVDLVRCAIGRNVPVTAEGFFDQGADSFAVLRFPALNFLPVPEDVGVPRAAVQRFRFKPGQLIAGTLRLPREREKSIMLEQVTAIEGVPPDEWQEPIAFDNLTPLYPEGRIMLENTKTELDQRAGGRSSDATREGTARFDRGRAARRQDDSLKGNREGDPGKSSRDHPHHSSRR